MQYFNFSGMLMALTLLTMPFPATASGMEERDHIYLYDQYVFPPEKDGGILLSLTYIVPGCETAKGIETVIESVLKLAAARQHLENGVKTLMIHILLYPRGTVLFFELTIDELNAFTHNSSI